MGNFGERCSSCNFDGKFPRGREPQIGGAEKVCVRRALYWRIEWEMEELRGTQERERRDAQKQASVIWDFDLLELLQDLDISFGSMGSIMTKAIYFMSAPCKLANKCYWTKTLQSAARPAELRVILAIAVLIRN